MQSIRKEVYNMHLCDDDILKILTEYVNDSRFKQAVLIDGLWGSGKTFFVKEKLIKKLENEITDKNVYYISLYGINSSNQFNSCIMSKISEKIIIDKIKVKNADTVLKGAKIAFKFGKTVLNSFINIDTENLPNLADILDIKDCVFILDDLERCEMNINQLLGCINDLIEHNESKIIIIANQSEIGRLSLSKDLPQKYLVVLNERIDLIAKDVAEKKQDENKKISKQTLIEQTEKLFSEDILYEKIKEKLIGLTIYYEANLNSIYGDLVEEYVKSQKAKEYILQMKESVLSVFQRNNHTNIRTFIFALIAFDKFECIFNESYNNETRYLEEQKKQILYYTFELAIKIKNGNYQYPWNESLSKSGMVYWDDKVYHIFGQKIYGYKFIDDYLLYRSYNEADVIKLINDLIEERKSNEEQIKKERSLSIGKLWDWWELEDDEIRSLLKQLINELINNDYSINSYKSIISLLMQINNNFEKIDFDSYIDIMIDNVNKNEESIDERYFEFLSENSEQTQEYDKLIKPLMEVIQKKNYSWINKLDIYFTGKELWNDNFINLCDQYANDFLKKRKFLSCYDISNVNTKIEKAKTKEIYNFIDGIKKVYNFSNLSDFYISDIENISKLLSDIRNVEDSTNKTKSMAINRLREDLEMYLDNLKNK